MAAINVHINVKPHAVKTVKNEIYLTLVRGLFSIHLYFTLSFYVRKIYKLIFICFFILLKKSIFFLTNYEKLKLFSMILSEFKNNRKYLFNAYFKDKKKFNDIIKRKVKEL